ncbi:MAG TPA: amino acid adenylation domain-containing protein [Thermoanaerobaculia bacterium]|nr:amino acid adenylation domain-containing protein [Thermoanaerobaculia bacterium]
MPVLSARVRPVTVAGLLRLRAAESADREAYLFLADGEADGERLTWGELDRRARAISRALRASLRPSDRALLLYPPGLDFVAAFFGCLYAGVVAVPAYPPRPNDRTLDRLRAVARDAEPSAALTTASLLALAGRAPELAGARWIATDTLEAPDTLDEDLPEDPEALAFLQYTSGSTSTPKGVMVTHANLMHNEAAISEAFRQDESSVVVGWLPLYHDMGLIGNVLQPLHAGSRAVLMAPAAFLQRPRRWLEAISRHRATTSGGPSFAYELCVRRIPPEQRAGLDLRSWRLAFNGAEPVRADTMERFAAAFAPCGFDPAAFYPCYGLAEATLFVSGGEAGRLPHTEPVVATGGRPLVSCGHAWGGQRIAIADPETGVELPPGAEGEIWVAGPSVAAGYWRNPEATERDFRARLIGSDEPFLRTGDLGLMSGSMSGSEAAGDLYVTGRIKDLVILRGRNHYPQDLERTAEAAHPELRPGGAAAFSVSDESGEERLVIVAEVERRRHDDLGVIAEAVRRAIAEEHEVQAGEVVLVRVGGVPKTSSGKVRRSACRAALQAGELPVLARSGIEAAVSAISDNETDAGLDAAGLAALPAAERRAAIERFLRFRAAAALGIAAAAIEPERPLTVYGLDSLAALELKGSVEAALGVSLPLGELLEGAGTAKLAEGLTPRPPLPGEGGAMGEGGQGGEVSFGERALWFLDRLAPDAGAYNIVIAARVHGALDMEALRLAFAALTDRHEALRTIFPLLGDVPVRRVLPAGTATVDFRVVSGDERPLAELLAAEAWRPFDLAAGPLVRVRVVRAAAEQVLLLSIHHMVADFWSLAVMARDLGRLYRGQAVAGAGGRAASDFARWQAEMLAGPRGEALWDFWRRTLAGAPDLDLPTDRPRPPVQTWRGSSREAVLSAAEAAAARALASGHGATLFAALLAVFEAQLGRYAGQDDFAVGTPTAGRAAPGWEETVGYLVNPAALRANLAGDPGFDELLARARKTAVAALENADFPFALLAERLRPSRDPARPPIFQVMLTLHSQRPGDPPGLAAFALGEDGSRLAVAGLDLESVRLAERRSQFEVSLSAAELPDGGIGLSIEINADLFDDATADRMLGHFRTLLAAAAADPERPAGRLPLLAAAEREQLAAEWRESTAPAVEVPPVTLHEAVARVAARTPEAAALEVEVEEGSLTYRELAERSAALARRLRAMGVGPEVPVALCVERSADLVVGLLGILSAGGVYLPLDPEHSAARLGFVLGDAGAAALVTQRSVAARLDLPAAPLVVLEELDGADGLESVSAALPDNLAYLIYTSGSTGRPKGVGVSHGAALAHCLTWAAAYRLSAGDRVLQFASPGFDASIEQIFATLLAGATLVLRGREPWGTLDLTRRLTALDLTVADLPTAFWSRWIADLGPNATDGVPPRLRLVGIGGEELRAETARLWRSTPLSRVPLLNSYGPTEAVVSATLYAVPPVETAAGAMAAPVPIGRSLAGRVARVLGRGGEPQPVGVPGELCLGGVLARGYVGGLGRPDLTAERFVPDPFAAAPGERLYRSGDRVRRRPDGEIEFLGRFDDQVKVCGFRIEPGEIETALSGHSGIRDAAVLALGAAGTDERRLVAFVVPRAGDRIPEDLRGFLAGRLPDYMIPSAWVSLPALPLNPNGKVDRAALARLAPETVPGETGTVTAAPRTPAEEILAGLFAELLGRERVGIHDDFFALGGHSLLATRAVSRIARLFGTDLPVSALFQAPTVAALAARLDLLAAAPTLPPIRPLPRDGAPLPLSFAQQRLWFLDRLEPGTAVYNLPGAVDLAGPLAVPALAAALATLAARHEPLRTVYALERGEPVQRILRFTPALPVIDLAGLPPALRATEAERQGRREARAPFDLARGPVLRTLLLRLAAAEHRLLVTLHHIAADGWSLGLFLDELAALLDDQNTRPVPALAVQYADWAAWQRAWMEGAELAAQLAWWRERLAGLPVLDLPADRPRPAVRDPRGGSRSRPLAADLEVAVARLARQAGCTAFMVLLGAFQTLLARITGEDVIPVGSPVANRRRLEAEPLIGLFVNTLVLTARTGDDPGFDALLARVREACLGAYAHQDVPFERLVQELQPERDLGQNPLFQVMLVLDEPLPPRRAGALALTPRRADSGTSRFDLMLAVTPAAEGGWTAVTEHAAALFEPPTVDRLLGHFATLLAGAAADPATRLSALPLLTAAEQAQLAEWNDTAAPISPGLRLHDLVAAQAARTPDAEAVVGEDERITYAELMARAARVAHALRAVGIAGPEARVGLCLRRTPDLLAAILGILAAGGAYVPLDPAYPQERLDFMLTDSGARALWTERELADRFGFFQSAVLLAEDAVVSPSPGGWEGVGEGAGGEGLAYIIYTSGSTGRPKGVGIEHRSAVALVRWALGVFPPEDLRGVLAATSVCFDLSIFEFFVPLAAGGRVILAPGVLELPQLAALGEVTLVNAVPSPMAELVRGGLPPGLRTVNLAGEALKPELVEKIYAHPQVERVVNLYGPSEDTTYSTWTVVPRGVTAVTIGRPIAGTRAWVLGRRGEALPVGVPGELCLGGAGLARGYLGRPELTAERFVPDPFGAAGDRLYRTGDRARLRAQGAGIELEFLGRFDQQVKLRGQRIELGEIEVTLESCPVVDEAVVMMRTDGAAGEPRLVGYLVAAAGEGGSITEQAEAFLHARLPAAFVPTAWVVLDAFPRSPNGKVDRRALPAPEARERGETVAPRTPLEERLAGVWREVLGVERVGIHDSFFALGGHSLLAVRMAFRIAETCGFEVPVTAVFAAPTVAEMAARLAEIGGLRRPSPPDLVGEGERFQSPLSFAQQRLWFLDLLAPGSALYNLSVPMRFDGPLDIGRLERALAEIVRRHEPLRTVYRQPEGETEPVQVVLPVDALTAGGLPRLSFVSLERLPEPARSAAARALLEEQAALPFDLRNGPVARFVLLELGGEVRFLAATFHHIAADGWSLGIFSRELAALYESGPAGSPLPELPLRYTDFAVAERRALAGGAFDRQLAYWRRQLADLPVLELPTDRPRPLHPSPRSGVRPVDLPAGLAASLAALGRGAGCTPFMILLAGFTALLARLSGQDDFGVGVPSAGRSRAETEGMIGLFVNTLVLRARPARDPLDPIDPTFLDLARRVRDTVVAAQESQDVPFEKLVEELQPERATGTTPLFQVMFAFLSDPAATLRMTGLSVSLVDLDTADAKFDLTLSIHEWEGRLEGALSYRSDLFDAATIDRLAGHLRTLLAGAVADPARRLSDLPLLTAAEQWQIAGEWTATGRAFALDRCIHELVAEQAARTPDLPAIVSEAGTVTYRELDARAGRLARVLRSHGVGPDVAVGLHAERSADWVIGALAALKAGGAWLPLDPDYPAERLAAMLAAAAAPVVLTQSHLAATLPPYPARVLRLDAPDIPDDWAGGRAEGPGSLSPGQRPGLGEGLACLFFTSGSTGQPKGVMVPHRGLVNRLLAAQELYGLRPGDAVLLKAAAGFDFSVWECFGPLIAGARIVVARPGGHRDAGYLVRTIVEQQVTLVHFVPSMLAVFLAEDGVERCVSLRQVFAGGERLTPELRRLFFSRLSIPLDNQYGPTEISIDTTRWVCAPGQDPWRVPIGRPIANTRLSLLDRALRPVPVGVTGEICVAGAGVTRGYLGRPDLTAERFIPEVFGDGGRMYRTGDLARWLPDGTIEFLGRADQQVKVRGVRIEPAEVEAALLRHPAVAAAAVVADPQGARLIAYWVTRPEASAASPADLRAALRKTLPDTMIPALFVPLDRLPLTPSGKLDRRALPSPGSLAGSAAEEKGAALATGDEELLAGIWRELLGVERVGAGDSFFDLGGHSLLATQLISRVRSVFGIDLPLAAVFEEPTLGALARRLQEARRARAGAPVLPPLVSEGGEGGTEAPL